MRKIVNISFSGTDKIICIFNNGEKRLLDLSQVIKDKYADKIIKDKNIFKSAKIGKFGEIYWSNIAEIIELDGKKKPCEYDISPEFVYVNSSAIDETAHTNARL